MSNAQYDILEPLNLQERAGFLYETYGERIFNLAYRMSGNCEDAADITQETFVRVFRNLSTFRGEAQIYTWIYAIAVNVCRRQHALERKSSFTALEDLLHTAADEKAETAFSEGEKNSLITQVKEGCLTGLLGCLTFPQRTAFILHTLLRLPLRDVAAVLEKSEGAVKLLVHRAKTNLKSFLCRNCSLYDESNACHCETLIHFSLKQGWISLIPAERRHAWVGTEEIEADIRRLRKEIELYATLPLIEPPQTLECRLRALIQSENWAIFENKKT